MATTRKKMTAAEVTPKRSIKAEPYVSYKVSFLDGVVRYVYKCKTMADALGHYNKAVARGIKDIIFVGVDKDGNETPIPVDPQGK